MSGEADRRTVAHFSVTDVVGLGGCRGELF